MKNRKSQKLFLAQVLLLVSIFVFTLAVPGSAVAEITFGVYTGLTKSHNSDLSISQPGPGNDFTLFDVSYSNGSFGGTAPYYGLRAGYFFDSIPFLGIEIEFLHARFFADTDKIVRISGTRGGVLYDQTQPMEDIVEEFEIHHGMNYLFFNLAGRYGFFKDQNYPAGKILLIGRLGVGPTIPHADTEVDGQHSHGNNKFDGVGFQFSVGPEMFLWKRLSLFGEYKLVYNKVSVKVFEGTANTELLAHHFILGLSVHY